MHPISIELDIGQPYLRRFHFLGAPHQYRASRPGRCDEQCVIVNDHLAVQGDHALILGDDERIDLRQRGVGLRIHLPKPHGDLIEILPYRAAGQ